MSFWGGLVGLVKGAVVGFVTGGPAGAVVGGAMGAVSGSSGHSSGQGVQYFPAPVQQAPTSWQGVAMTAAGALASRYASGSPAAAGAAYYQSPHQPGYPRYRKPKRIRLRRPTRRQMRLQMYYGRPY